MTKPGRDRIAPTGTGTWEPTGDEVRTWLTMDWRDLVEVIGARHGFVAEERHRAAVRVEPASWRHLADDLADSGVHEIGWIALEIDIDRAVCNLCWVMRALASGDVAFVAADPVVVTGLPRSGTTFLQAALGELLRPVRFWEGIDPAATWRDRHGDAGVVDAARAASLERISLQRMLGPGLDAIHPLRADDAEECCVPLQMSMLSARWIMTYDVPDYLRYWLDAPKRDAYALYADTLSVIAAGEAGPVRFALKCPWHLGDLDAVVTTWPGAKIVRTVREPMACMASLCSMVREVRSIAAPRVDAEGARRIGADWLELEATASLRADEFARMHRESVLDIDFVELAGDPDRVLAEVCAWAGIDASLLERSRAIAVAQSGRNRGHRWSLEEWGLSAADACRFTA